MLDEEFEGTLIWRRDDGVGALDAFAVAIDTEGGVLTGFVVIRAARIDLEDKKVFGNLSAFTTRAGRNFSDGVSRKPLN